MKQYITESIQIRNDCLEDKSFLQTLEQIISSVEKSLLSGNKILIAGNGGSAADAQHFSAEIVGRYKKERKGYPAIALTTDTSVITAWGNDYSFDTIFSRQIEALGNSGDIFIGISTSGNSKNVIEAVKMAKNKGIKTICLLGNNGGNLKNICDQSLIVPSENTPRVQEMHIQSIHIICEELDKKLT